MRKKLTAMMIVGNQDSLKDATSAILNVLAAKGHVNETYQEALRTLAVIGKPPMNNNISNCSFTQGRVK